MLWNLQSLGLRWAQVKEVVRPTNVANAHGGNVAQASSARFVEDLAVNFACFIIQHEGAQTTLPCGAPFSCLNASKGARRGFKSAERLQGTKADFVRTRAVSIRVQKPTIL